jgi:sarcosine oxidase/L-pipecolate oxidase
MTVGRTVDSTVPGDINGHANGHVNGNLNGSASGHGKGPTNGHLNDFANGAHTHVSPPFSSIIIIGAGNFGAATALELAKRFPGRIKITLIDTSQYLNPRAASHDVNKIVRDDYPDSRYMIMMLTSMPRWRNNKLYSKFYHEVGMLRADQSSFGVEAIAAYRALRSSNSSEFLTVDEVRSRWNGAFDTADFGDLEKVLYNPSVGFVEADKVLGAVVQAAVDHGVTYEVGEMSRLTFNAGGQCTGIELTSGKELRADKVLMATGARTSVLLAKSAPKNKKLHAGDRLVATGAVSFRARLHGDLKDKFATIPVLKNCLPQ